MKSITKITAGREILEAFVFLGIPTEKFEEMKNMAGGIFKLHDEVAIVLSGGISGIITIK